MTIKVNGIELFYEKTGQGSPVILLHGNGENHEIFDVLIEKLSANYTLYAIDSRGHGKSEKVRTINYEDMAEDIAAFIGGLNLQKPSLYGFSDGGIAGLLIAIKYPDLLSKLAISGANINPKGFKRFFLAAMSAEYFFTRNENIKMMITQPDIKEEQLAKIVTPTLVLAGSKDMIRESHTKTIAENIPGSVLKILQGETHSSYVIHSDKLRAIIETFLGR
ncbi:MAG: alpha/beta hydrolase [Clostridiales bacterium]|jgi:pimeloyl-ACP methyl ester carboxylesterase|nr:alpha/beta hydrolase [Clostridiales bacterium]